MRHRSAVVGDVELHWAELGEPGDRTPVVLLHGIADSHLTWQHVAGPLARDRLVLMLDLPGCGLSGRPDASYELEWHAHVVAQWLEQLKLTTVDVVGHSFGGGVAQMLLLEHRLRIRRLVLVASGGLGREASFWLKFATFPFFVEHFGQPFMAFGTRLALGDSDGHDSADIAELSAMNARPGTARAFSRSVRDVLSFRGQTRHFLQRAHEAGSLPPVALLWGERDPLLPIKHGRDLAERLEGAVFVPFPDCGHYVHRGSPEAFVEAVRGFLDAPTVPSVTLREPVHAGSDLEARLRPTLAAARARVVEATRQAMARMHAVLRGDDSARHGRSSASR